MSTVKSLSAGKNKIAQKSLLEFYNLNTQNSHIRRVRNIKLHSNGREERKEQSVMLEKCVSYWQLIQLISIWSTNKNYNF
jgi:hypothetical protein